MLASTADRDVLHSLTLTNRILSGLPDSERATLLANAEYMVLPAGHTLANPGEPVLTGFFPSSGVIAWISEMATGHRAAVASIGVEGVVGSSAVLAIPRHPFRVVALLETAGYRVSSATFRRMFSESDAFRTAALAHIGRHMIEVASLVACARVHSHQQRLARWLAMITAKADESSLAVTHDVLAQLVGGPRHAVTVALNELKEQGAITHLRGKVEVLNRSTLAAHACECYRQYANLTASTPSD
jgi:CRP-like cAMP-binding protein